MPEQRCRHCGCTNEQACVRPAGMLEATGGPLIDGIPHTTCSWAEPDLCTACVPGAGDDWTHPA